MVQGFPGTLRSAVVPVRGLRHLWQNLTEHKRSNEVCLDVRCPGSGSLDAETETGFWCRMLGERAFRAREGSTVGKEEERSKAVASGHV